MKVLHTTDLSREGNDCYLYESVNLIEDFGMYTIIVSRKVVGWFNSKDFIMESAITCDLDEAIDRYKRAGGVINEA